MVCSGITEPSSRLLTRDHDREGTHRGRHAYHLEKGHYLFLLEETLNEGIEAVVDDDAAGVTFPDLLVAIRMPASTCAQS